MENFLGGVVGFLVGAAGFAFIGFVLITTGTHMNGNAKLMGSTVKKKGAKKVSFTECRSLRGGYSQKFSLKEGTTYNVNLEIEEDKGEVMVNFSEIKGNTLLNTRKSSSFNFTPKSNIKGGLSLKFEKFNGSVSFSILEI